MSPPLQLVLPIRNAAIRLRREAEVLLEMMAEAARDFELLIVDLGSTDDSLEVIEELSREFRQIRGIRKPPATGLKQFIDEIRSLSNRNVVVHGGLWEGVDLERQWLSPPADPTLPVLTKGPKNLHTRLLGRLTSWGKDLKQQGESPVRSRPGATFMEHLRMLVA